MNRLSKIVLALFFMGIMATPVFAGGNFSMLKDRSTGDTVVADDDDAEWQNIISNLTPAGIDDASASVSAQQAYTNPSSSLPTSLEGEIQGLRYQLGQAVHGSSSGEYWYNAPATIERGYQNLMPNPSFEYWANDINEIVTIVPRGWKSSSNPTDVEIFTTGVERDNYGGFRAVKITTSSTWDGINYTLANLKPSTRYYISVRAKAGAGDQANLSVSGEADPQLSEFTTSETWVNLVESFTTDSTPTDIVIFLGSAISGDIAYFDKIVVVEGNFPAAFTNRIVAPLFPNYQNLKIDASFGRLGNGAAGGLKINADWIVVENETHDRLVLQDVDIDSITQGSLSDGTTYALYVIYNPSTAVIKGRLDASYTAPTLEAGFTYWRLIGLVRITTAATQIHKRFYQQNDRLFYKNPTNETVILTNADSAAWASVATIDYTGDSVICGVGIFVWRINAIVDSPTDVQVNSNNNDDGKLLTKADATDNKLASGEFTLHLHPANNEISYKTNDAANVNLSMEVAGCILNL